MVEAAESVITGIPWFFPPIRSTAERAPVAPPRTAPLPTVAPTSLAASARFFSSWKTANAFEMLETTPDMIAPLAAPAAAEPPISAAYCCILKRFAYLSGLSLARRSSSRVVPPDFIPVVSSVSSSVRFSATSL